jgi:hypothetical protein
VIRKFPAPRNTRGISCFISMVNFYHKFIPQLADVVAPLNTLRKKGVKFVCVARNNKRLVKF